MLRALKALSLLLVVGLATPVVPATAAPSGTATAIYAAVVEDLSPRVAGHPTDFTASLFSGELAVPGQVLTLWLRPWGASTFVAAGHATTDASGSVTVWATLERDAEVQWRYAGAGLGYDASTSMPYVVQIAPRVTTRVNDRTLRRGQRFVATGRTFPAKAGCTVSLWRGELRPLVAGPAPVRLARTTARADGSYRLVRRFHRKARMRVVVTVSACAGNARGLSRYVAIRVR